MSTVPSPNADATSELGAEVLLARLDRVRALARRLVRDAAEADDLVQDALVRALERPGRVAGDPGPWLRAVLGNAARDRARREGRRAAREEAAARPEAQSAADATAILAERQRDVIDAVLALDEPYRSVVLLRFFDEAAPRAIAARLGRPVSTVKKQLERGLARLRAKLEERYGDRGAWAVALLPVAQGEGARLGLGALFGGLALLVVAAIPLVSAILGPEAETTRGTTPDALSPPAATAGAAPEKPEPGTPAETRTAVAERAQTAATVRSLEVNVVDWTGAPISGFEVEWNDRGIRNVERGQNGETYYTVLPEADWYRAGAVTDEEGRAMLRGVPSTHADRGKWRSVDERWALVEIALDREDRWTLILAPAVRVAGRTVDHEGSPLARVRCDVTVSLDVLTDSEVVEQLGLHARRPAPGLGGTRSGEGGRFELGRVPFHADWRLEFGLAPQRHVEVPIPASDSLHMEVVLPDPAPRRVERIFGMAVDFDGTPLVDATVRFGQDQARTDGSGRFELDVSSRHPGSPITVRATDGRFAVADAPSREAALAEEGAGPVLLRLPRAVHALRGRVVDHLGRPMSQVRVVAMNATPIGSALGLRYEYSTGPRLEQHEIQTNIAGEFEVPFLRDRPYFMRFIDVDTMVVADVHDVRARDGELEVRLPTDDVVASLEGRVLDDFGHPVPGAQVALHAKLRHGTGPGFASVWGRAVTADGQGRFAIRRAPWRGLSLEALPPEKDGRWAGLDLEAPPTGAVELRVERSGEVVLDVPDDRVTRAVFFAPVEEALAVKELEPGRTRYTTHASRGAGGSFPLIRVSQRATTISLRDAEGRELRRVPLRVAPGERVVVR